ncbi:MAG: DEAD/DEAH box helicase family protein [Bacteroidota bacterium]|nr:DEAD/DEAH box helicase family protein [Bacteroidota bacterium]
MHLYQALHELVTQWRTKNYNNSDYSSISEILEWAKEPEGSGFLLRQSQFRALETYWFLRLQCKTPHIFELYKHSFSSRTELLKALGISSQTFEAADFDEEKLWQKIKSDDSFAVKHKLDAIKETLTLEYPSYIFALAMGAGKTALIGAIIATEFAMADEYPEGPFIQNALVFAPGTTIIQSLREIASLPYDRILPPRFFKRFSATVKLTFTRDGDPDIPIIPNSNWNIVVTNTEKIRIQKETIRKSDLGLFAPAEKEEEARTDVANRRLQKIASLPHLAVFSDEAHHTYGQALGTELKRVRQTVDYLYHNSPNLICVVNTTGTPYFKKQILRDVVAWYGLSEGIRDGILKQVSDNIHSYSFGSQNTDKFISQIITEFFSKYGNVSLPNGAIAKLAIYFPQTDDLKELRPVIEATLVQLGYSPTICLRNTNESTKDEIDAFNRLNDPASTHRVILLVGKGTEGWNCPSLFACALARQIRSSNNLVLQASSRCLRQVPGNETKASIYLSEDNRTTLDDELKQTYGESIADLNNATSKSKWSRIVLRKVDIPPIKLRRLEKIIVKKEQQSISILLVKPDIVPEATIVRRSYRVVEGGSNTLEQVADPGVVVKDIPMRSVYDVAIECSSVYRLDVWTIHDELQRLYGTEVPEAHIENLRHQIEQQTSSYSIEEIIREDALALIKKEGFTEEISADGAVSYVAEISYPISKEELLTSWEEWQERNKKDFSFHYSPYNFDSTPEKSFLEVLLGHLDIEASHVEDIFFTGAINDPKKTDFSVDYKGNDNKWHKYTPDFIVKRKDGKCMIVEIKQENKRDDLIDGECGAKALAVQELKSLNPDMLEYQMIFTSTDEISFDKTKEVREFVKHGHGTPT